MDDGFPRSSESWGGVLVRAPEQSLFGSGVRIAGMAPPAGEFSQGARAVVEAAGSVQQRRAR